MSRAETIQQCLRTILENTNIGFVLVGGAAGIITGSSRATLDIDLLLASDVDPRAAQSDLLRLTGFSAPGGALTYTGSTSMGVDILKTVIDKTYNDLRDYVSIQDGIPILNRDAALAIKIHCFNLRAEDEHGRRKADGDIDDVKWLALCMKAAGETISDEVARHFKIGHYRLLLVRLELTEEETSNLVAVGATKLLRAWDDDTPEQKEYYKFFAPAGSCPLTTDLSDLWKKD